MFRIPAWLASTAVWEKQLPHEAQPENQFEWQAIKICPASNIQMDWYTNLFQTKLKLVAKCRVSVIDCVIGRKEKW